MSEMIERVARAILEESPGFDRGADRIEWHHLNEIAKDIRLEQARAAILAMREPMKPAIRSGAREIAEYGLKDNEKVEVPGTSLWDELAYISWQAMIDAALK